MKATDRERAHFAAIAASEGESERQRIEDALCTTPGERIRRGFAMAASAMWTPAHLAELDARTDGQMELARRRVALGLGLTEKHDPR